MTERRGAGSEDARHARRRRALDAATVSEIWIEVDRGLDLVSRRICARLRHRVDWAAACPGGCPVYHRALELLEERLPGILASLADPRELSRYLHGCLGALTEEVRRRHNAAEGVGARLDRRSRTLGRICDAVVWTAGERTARALAALDIEHPEQLRLLAEAIHLDASQAPAAGQIRDDLRVARYFLRSEAEHDIAHLRVVADAFEDAARSFEPTWFERWVASARRAQCAALGAAEVEVHSGHYVDDDVLRATDHLERLVDAAPTDRTGVLETGALADASDLLPIVLVEAEARAEVLQRIDALERPDVVERAARSCAAGVEPIDAIRDAAAELGLEVEGSISARLVGLVRRRSLVLRNGVGRRAA